MEIVKQVTLDLLPTTEPALSATSDVPIIETKPDATPETVVPAATEAKEAKPEESAPPEKPTDDSSATPDEAKKPAKGVQKRIDELTRQREDERRAREAAEARELRILTALEKATGVSKEPEKTVDTEPVKPQPNQFSNPEDFDAALENWIMERSAFIADRKVAARFEEEKRKAAEEARLAHQKRVQDEFNKRVETARQKYSDYQEVAESPDVQVSMPIAYAILNSEQGPEIQYFLGKNPEEAKRISAMTVQQVDQSGQLVTVPDTARQLVELGQIVSRLNQPAPTARPVSAAPAPIKPIEKASTTAEKSPDEMSMEEYAAMRKPQLNRRPGVRH